MMSSYNILEQNFYKYCLKLLYCLYYFNLYIYVNVDVVHGAISDLPLYHNLATVYNYERECIANANDNLDTCRERAWHIVDNMNLESSYHAIENANISYCYHKCLSKAECVAVVTDKTTNKCWLYHANYKEKPGETNFVAHFLKCCSLDSSQSIKVTDEVAPMVFTPKDNCLQKQPANEHSNNEEKNKYAFHYVQGKNFDVSPSSNYSIQSSFECMTHCLRNIDCKAYRVQVISKLLLHCYIYTQLTNAPTLNDTESHSFQKIICNVEEKKLWISNNADLLMLYNPGEICKTFSLTNIQVCMWKIWHVEDNLRLKNHYKETVLSSVQNCLNTCLKESHCYGISIDWTDKRCLFFQPNKYKRFFGQKRWTTYTLECCNSIHNESNTSDHNHNYGLTILREVDDMSSRCEEPTIENVNLCEEKAWLVMKGVQLTEKILEKTVSHNECANMCLTHSQCKGFSTDDGKCTLYANQEKRDIVPKHTSYILICCPAPPKTNVSDIVTK